MKTHESKPKKSQSTPTVKPANPLASRPFLVQPQTEQLAPKGELAETKAKQQNLAKLGSKLAAVPFADPSPTPPPQIQLKRAIREPGDSYEPEADTVAAQVAERINAPQISQPSLQRQATPEAEVELRLRPIVQRRAEAGEETSTSLEPATNRIRDRSQPRDTELQCSMEADFSGVKVHTIAQADRLNQAMAVTDPKTLNFYQPQHRKWSLENKPVQTDHIKITSGSNPPALQMVRERTNESIERLVGKIRSTKVSLANLERQLNYPKRSPNYRDLKSKYDDLAKEVYSLSAEDRGYFNYYYAQRNRGAEIRLGILTGRGVVKYQPGDGHHEVDEMDTGRVDEADFMEEEDLGEGGGADLEEGVKEKEEAEEREAAGKIIYSELNKVNWDKCAGFNDASDFYGKFQSYIEKEFSQDKLRDAIEDEIQNMKSEIEDLWEWCRFMMTLYNRINDKMSTYTEDERQQFQALISEQPLQHPFEQFEQKYDQVKLAKAAVLAAMQQARNTIDVGTMEAALRKLENDGFNTGKIQENYDRATPVQKDGYVFQVRNTLGAWKEYRLEGVEVDVGWSHFGHFDGFKRHIDSKENGVYVEYKSLNPKMTEEQVKKEQPGVFKDFWQELSDYADLVGEQRGGKVEYRFDQGAPPWAIECLQKFASYFKPGHLTYKEFANRDETHIVEANGK